MTLGRFEQRVPLLIPVLAVLFTGLAVGAAVERLPWDEPLARWVLDRRTPRLDDLARRVSGLGSTRVVLVVAALAAAASAKRCPRLAIAIIALALARPLTEWGLKELVGRERPDIDRLVPGNGPSFPSGHPFAAAASWCLLPLVVALYTRSRRLWWSVAVAVWVIAVAVAGSRVYLGVHWPSDVVGGLLAAVLGVALAERLILHTHDDDHCPTRSGGRRR